jgi:hypothetical protein
MGSTTIGNLPQPGDWQQVLAFIRNLATGSSSIKTGVLQSNSFVYTNTAGALESPRLALMNGQLLIGAQGNPPQTGTITGTTNQVIVTLGSGTIGLSLPQSIGTGNTPTFAGVVLNNTFQLVAGAVSGRVLTSDANGVGTWLPVGAAGSVRWDQIVDPGGNLTLNLGANTSTFNWGNTGTTVPLSFTFGAISGGGSANQFAIQDTTGSTTTGALLNVQTVGSSTALPFRVTAQGTANGIRMGTDGIVTALGTGGVAFSALTGTTSATPQFSSLGLNTPAGAAGTLKMTGALNLVGTRTTQSSIAVGASPFTYTNNDNAVETIYTFGGTVTDVSFVRNSTTTTISSLTNVSAILSPGDGIQVTYSVAPTMVKVIF